MIVYEGKDLKVTFYPFESEIVLFLFSDLDWDLESRRNTDLGSKFGMNVIFFGALEQHWWQTEEAEGAASAVKEISNQYPERVAYGSSMGGYGALWWSGRLNANRCIAVSPQTNISDANLPLLQPWKDAIAKRPIYRDQIAEDIPSGLLPRIIYDPRSKIDASHANWLANKKTVSLDIFPFSTHKLLTTLYEAGSLREAVQGLIRGSMSTAELRLLTRISRPKSHTYSKMLQHSLILRNKSRCRSM
ncbi:hypothetical protein [Methylorubrum extorquens]|uniref:hypothetical protein n=1 Tax=Methylorubrum extorquens TaxID=408 RepID=UPI0011BD5474|nr:hypothetical protein [Methylorubrum extorquens]